MINVVSKAIKLYTSFDAEDIWEAIAELHKEYNISLEDFAKSDYYYEITRAKTHIDTKAKKHKEGSKMTDEDIRQHSKIAALTDPLGNENNIELHRGYKNSIKEALDILKLRIGYIMHMNNRDLSN